jgi:hypothetical protein
MRSCLLSLVLLVLGAGCASPPPISDDPFAVTPIDFSLDLTVLFGKSNSEDSVNRLRPSRCVLFPDGSLYYGEGAEFGPDRIPPLIRRLNRRQVAGVWSLAQQLGFADPDNGSEPTNFTLIHPEPGEIVDLIRISGQGRRWEFVRTSSFNEPDPASMQLMRLLSQLAWASDTRLSSESMPPVRYDYGPDPYAIYR